MDKIIDNELRIQNYFIKIENFPQNLCIVEINEGAHSSILKNLERMGKGYLSIIKLIYNN